MPKYKKHDVLLIRWEDHCHASGWQSKINLDPLWCLSAGFFIAEDKNHILLAQNLGVADLQPGNTMQIIKGDIAEIKVLSRAKKG